MSQINFDATQVAPQSDRSAQPEGTYKVILKTSEIKPTAKNDGKFIACGMQILEGPIAGRMIFFNINHLNPNPVAQQIGQERLSALCHAVNVLKISDTAQLHGRPFQIKVTVSEDGKYNEVQAFLREDGSAITPQTAAPAGPTAAPAWAGAAAPTPAPASPAPAPAPSPAPVPAPAPVAPQAPAPADDRKFYVAHNGQNITGSSPISADQVRALPQGLAALQICQVGNNAWESATSLAIATPAPVPAPAPGGVALPPWLQNQPPQG